MSVQVLQLIQETAFTPPISEPFCPLSLPPSTPTPPDSKTTPPGNPLTESPDFSFAAEISHRNIAAAASPLPSTTR
ncbi:hypothetical protein F2Q69_00009965 [Brassica cretica]|uniref:Uncharacterized protein n=1 Tax=Brassica cretica TaxID=69181 RepID=A0A8S9PN20_BRACR|nr:hypothetical protein F2Q69_00009965 [Brassica cretica]